MVKCCHVVMLPCCSHGHECDGERGRQSGEVALHSLTHARTRTNTRTHTLTHNRFCFVTISIRTEMILIVYILHLNYYNYTRTCTWPGPSTETSPLAPPPTRRTARKTRSHSSLPPLHPHHLSMTTSTPPAPFLPNLWCVCHASLHHGRRSALHPTPSCTRCG